MLSRSCPCLRGACGRTGLCSPGPALPYRTNTYCCNPRHRYGNCNGETGQCDCPFGLAGASKSCWPHPHGCAAAGLPRIRTQLCCTTQHLPTAARGLTTPRPSSENSKIASIKSATYSPLINLRALVLQALHARTGCYPPAIPPSPTGLCPTTATGTPKTANASSKGLDSRLEKGRGGCGCRGWPQLEAGCHRRSPFCCLLAATHMTTCSCGRFTATRKQYTPTRLHMLQTHPDLPRPNISASTCNRGCCTYQGQPQGQPAMHSSPYWCRPCTICAAGSSTLTAATASE